MNHFEEVHSSSRVSVTCSLCRTDRSPGLMGRMHGAALGTFISEEMIAQISSRVSVPVHSLRKINFIHFMDDESQTDETLRGQGEVIAAARRGKHVFVEKPVSLFLDEAIEMNRATDQVNRESAIDRFLRQRITHFSR